MFPVPGQQFVEAGLGHVGDAGEHVGEPCERIDSVEFTGGDEAKHDRGAVTAAIRTNEEPGFSSPGNGSERAFGGIVGQTDAAIFEERDKGGPCVEHIVHFLADGVVGGEAAALFAHPGLQLFDERRRQGLAHGEPLGGRAAVDVALDGKDAVDALHSLERQRRDDDTLAGFSLQLGGDIGEFKEVAPRVRPARRMGDGALRSAGVIKRVVAGVIVGLEDALVADQMPPAVLAFAVVGIIEERSGRPGTCKRCVIADIRPHPGDVGFVFCQKRHRGVIGVKAFGAEHMGLEQAVQWPHSGCDPADLIGERREAEGNTLAFEAVALAVERLVQPELVEREAGEEVRAEHGTRRDVERCRRLGDGLACAAGEAFADGLDDLVVGGHRLQGAADAFAKLAQIIGPAAGAHLDGGNDDPLDGQTFWQRAAGAGRAGEGRNGRGFCDGLLRGDLGFGRGGLEFFEAKFHLLDEMARAF